MAKRLSGRVALVTGGSRGIGRAISINLAKEGAAVCVNYKNSRENAEEVVRQIRRGRGSAIAVQADIVDEHKVGTMVDQVSKRFGRVDILVNNAGVLHGGGIFTMKDRDLNELLDVNLRGTIYCTRLTAKQMMTNKYGKIINISSVGGLGTAHVASSTPYAISKAAIIILTKRLAFELGRFGINVNCVAPGSIATDMTVAGASPEQIQQSTSYSRQHSILGRMGTPEEVADAVVFLASNESRFITGQVLTVDGGRTDFLTHSA